MKILKNANWVTLFLIIFNHIYVKNFMSAAKELHPYLCVGLTFQFQWEPIQELWVNNARHTTKLLLLLLLFTNWYNKMLNPYIHTYIHIYIFNQRKWCSNIWSIVTLSIHETLQKSHEPIVWWIEPKTFEFISHFKPISPPPN